MSYLITALQDLSKLAFGYCDSNGDGGISWSEVKNCEVFSR